MAFFRALRDVIANLAQGQEPAALRPGPTPPLSAAARARLQAAEATERFLAAAVEPHVDAALHAALVQSVAHLETPILSVEALREWLDRVAVGNGVAMGRGGVDPSGRDERYAADLRALQAALARLGGARGGDTAGH